MVGGIQDWRKKRVMISLSVLCVSYIRNLELKRPVTQKCQGVQISPNKNKRFLSLAKGSEAGVRGDQVGRLDSCHLPAVL